MAKNNTMRLVSILAQTGWYKGVPGWGYGAKNIPVALSGVPGTGKTEIVIDVLGKALGARLDAVRKQPELAKHLANPVGEGWHTGVIVVSQAQPEEIAGMPLPTPEADAVNRVPLGTVKGLAQAGYGLIVFDELTSGSEAVGAAAMTAIQNGRYGDTVLPATVGVVAAFNPPDCAANGRDLSAPETNRFCVLPWALPNESFFDFLLGGRGAAADVEFLPPTWERDNVPRAAHLVSTFLRAHPAFVNQMEEDRRKGESLIGGDKPWASQRQWVNVIRMMAACMSVDSDELSDMIILGLEGMVGEAITGAFADFMRSAALPDPEDVLREAMKPEGKVKNVLGKNVLERPDRLRWALDSVARAARIEHEDKVARWEAAWRVLGPVLDTAPDSAQDAAKLLAEEVPQGCRLPEEVHRLFQVRKDASLSGHRK